MGTVTCAIQEASTSLADCCPPSSCMTLCTLACHCFNFVCRLRAGSAHCQPNCFPLTSALALLPETGRTHGHLKRCWSLYFRVYFITVGFTAHALVHMREGGQLVWFLLPILLRLSGRFSRQLTALLRGRKQPSVSKRWSWLECFFPPGTAARCFEVGGGDVV